MIAWPSGSVAVAANCAVTGATPSPPVTVAAEIVGLRLAWTTTLSVAVPVPPLPSDTVTTTLYVAAVANACVGFCCEEVGVESPKSHA